MDKLDKMFEMQREFEELVALKRNVKTLSKNFADETIIGKICTAIMHEAIELQRLTNWKWWKQPVQFDTRKAKEELIDIWHFVAHAAIELQMSPQEFMDVYEEKMKENHRRMHEGY